MSSSDLPLTLVAYYGSHKPPELRALIEDCHAALGESMGDSFLPYELDQVHGTIIGLEANRSGDRLLNTNFQELREEEREMQLEEVVEFVRKDAGWPLELRLCGFHSDAEYGFRSQDRHPYERSFCIKGPVAVAMGWPVTSEGYLMHLDAIRHRFQGIGVLHKWHAGHDDVDNDFYFVLGTIEDSVGDEAKNEATGKLRELMASRSVLNLSVETDDLSIVRYENSQLPLDSSVAVPVSAPMEELEKLLR